MQLTEIPINFQVNENVDEIRVLSHAIDSFNGAVLNHHNILESLTVGVVVIDLKGEIITFNRAAENITGLFSEKVIGKEFDKVFDPNFFLNSHLDFKSLKDIQENADVETEIRRKGKNTLYISLSISSVKNPKGKKIGIVFALQDITRLKKFEERANRTDRLAAMGKIAVKIAHEIRNPLGSIELFATVLKKDLEDFEELKTLAGHISSGVKSINNIISNLLLFIRPQQKPDFQTIDVYDSLNDSLFFSSHIVNSINGINIITRYYPEPLMVYADSELLKQLFLNLILNAVQAMPHGGKLTISTRKLNGRSRKDFARIIFADTGTGISKAEETISLLLRYDWNGNVRELENTIERAVLLGKGEVLLPKHLFLEEPGSNEGKSVFIRVGLSVKEMEKELIFQTLKEVNNNRTHAAKLLGISIRTLRNKLREYKKGTSL